MTDMPDGHLFIGGDLDATSRDRTGERTFVEASDFTTHGVIVGMTGSGKTGLGIIAIEEALLQGIPTIVIDPKGDMGNLDLVFPYFSPASFEPWVNPADAERDGVSVPEHAAAVAETWRSGLEGWGIGTPEMQRLDERPVTIYTPGSTAGVPVNLIGGLAAPPAGTDVEVLNDEIEGFVTSLLGMIDIAADPLSSREHILLSNLIFHAWNNGTDLDLPTLVGQIQTPPIRKLGVMELESFYPSDDRTALALKLNGLLASPAFAAWTEGAPLDIASLLDTTDGAKTSVFSLSHLADAERQFVVTLLLSKVITWMRAQPGTPELRALIYMDEVFGYVPPTAQPPAKKPILTILKQARAFGVGLVLSTQNPVDIDYKAISNAGTWMIGRLQTEQDKARLLDGLTAASGEVDVGELDNTISGLDKRQFVLHQTRADAPSLFTTRWAMSYLAGPLSRDQIARLTGDDPARQTAASPDAAAAADIAASPEGAAAPDNAAAQPAPAAPAPAAAVPATPATEIGDGESAVAPKTADGTEVCYLDAAAPWAAEIGASPGGTRLAAGLAARVNLLFDETKADLRHDAEWEAVVFPAADAPSDQEIVAVDYDDRDLRPAAPDGAIYVLPDARVDTKTFFKKAQSALKDHLYRNESVTLFHNEELKLYSRVGETEKQFVERCKAAADDRADEEAAKIRASLEKKLDRIEAAIAKAEDKVRETKETASGRKGEELLSGAMDVLGGLLGGRKGTRSILGGVRRASSKRRQSATAAERVETAKNRLAEKVDEHEALEVELTDTLLEIQETWEDAATEIAKFEVGLEKTDISIDDFRLVWIPVD